MASKQSELPGQGSLLLDHEAPSEPYQFPPAESAQGVAVNISDFRRGLDNIRGEIPRQEQRKGLIKAGKSPRLLGQIARREGDLGKAQDRVEHANHLHEITAARLRKEYAETAGYIALLDSGMFNRNEVNDLRSRATDAFMARAEREHRQNKKRRR